MSDSKLPRLTFRTDKETIDKLNTLAKLNFRPTNKQLELIVKQYLQEYEEKNGTINLQQINNEGTIHNIGNVNTQNINTK